jgi:hypothetical protein
MRLVAKYKQSRMAVLISHSRVGCIRTPLQLAIKGKEKSCEANDDAEAARARSRGDTTANTVESGV